jgi:hypothetical protein
MPTQPASRITKAIARPTAPFDIFGIAPTFFIRGEEKQVTFMGCVCTVLMAILLGAVSVFYLYQFFEKVNFQVAVTDTTLSSFPSYDLNKNKFFVSMTFRVNGKVINPEEIEDNFFNLRANYVTIDQEAEDQDATIVRDDLAFEPCDKLSVDISGINVEADELDASAVCLEFESET